MKLPRIIQGGMGASISSWRLARAVSSSGHLGVVSGTALDAVLARRLQLGDIGGHMRRALAALPVPGVAERVLERYFVPGGKEADAPFRPSPIPVLEPSVRSLELTVAANFVEVFLAKEGHDGQVGINYLEKIQLPTLPSLHGALLAGVSCVIMGAGIPRSIPGVMESISKGEACELTVPVSGAAGERLAMRYDPGVLFHGEAPTTAKPAFFPIVSSVPLANMLMRKASGPVDGFIVEAPTAGGHNAPPRGAPTFDEKGQPVYGERDVVDPAEMAALGLPFWLAGGQARPDSLAKAIAVGAQGIQVGTAFAFCEESGMDPTIRRSVLARVRDKLSKNPPRVHTSAKASPTGFPFKVLPHEDTMSLETKPDRPPLCDLSYLRLAHRMDDGKVVWRCPSEPLGDYVKKGGDEADAVGRLCVCNGLMATAGYGQTRKDGYSELPLITSGDGLPEVERFLRADGSDYTAADVIESLGGNRIAEIEAEAAALLT
ncbi:MAG: nitronate monooxygenase [Planctomycetota bacterium]|nr:nitronate monooxygenase [Planctomycetota bacterium]